MTLKNNRAPLLSNIKLYASFHHHMWIQTGVTVRKRLSWVVTSVTLTFDLWPWPFAWTLLWSLIITPENFMMIRWWEHSQKGVTDRRTDRRTDGQTENTICRAAWSQLKIFTYGNEINLGRPPRTLTSATSRDLIMLPHRAVRHYWRWGDGIRSGLEPHWIAATVWYLLYGVIWYSINIYRGSLVIRKKNR